MTDANHTIYEVQIHVDQRIAEHQALRCISDPKPTTSSQMDNTNRGIQ